MNTKNAYEPPRSVSAKSNLNGKMDGIKKTAATCFAAVLVYALSTVGYVLWRFSAAGNFAAWKAGALEAVDLSVGLCAVVLGTSYLVSSMSFIRAFLASSLFLASALVVCDILASMLGLQPRSYFDDPGKVFRPVGTLVFYVASVVLLKKRRSDDAGVEVE